jgi:hypothetical protein
MKRRVRKIVNFFAFNLLFFALYLNFIHKDRANSPIINTEQSSINKPAFSGTVLAGNPEKTQDKKTTEAAPAQQLSAN